jgi:sterol desaturase/sphingolipid hydroxylase (fatty acid hydroxylase superfamily)
MIEILVRSLYLPLFLLVGNGMAIFWIAEGYPKIWLIAWILLFIGLSFIAEKLAPFDAVFNTPAGDRSRDICHAMINESLTVAGLWILPVFSGSLTLVSAWPSNWPLALQLILAVLIADVGISLAHYASHRLRLLWQLHAVHHSVKRMYGFNGLMKHPLHQLIETTAGVTPLLLIGASSEVLSLLAVAVVLQLLLQHSNVAYYAGPLKFILAINAVHRFHHLNTADEGDVNFGLFTTLTDHLLGTWHYDSGRVIASKDLGIASEPDYPVDYLSQFLAPFRKRREN